jgi:hypothetical protein
MQRGRKTVLNQPKPAVTSTRPLPVPPATLTGPERSLFLKLVDAHLHLKSSDTLVLATFCQVAIRFEKLGKTDNFRDWEKCGRMMMAMARGLRLLPTTAARTLQKMRDENKPSHLKTWLADHPDESDDGNNIRTNGSRH